MKALLKLIKALLHRKKTENKVLIDDVYSDGKPDGKHKLVSEAKADHFLHPNCRHQLFMYIEGVTEVAELPNDVETKEHYQAEQKQRYYEREIRKYKRLRDGSVDPADRQKYDARVKEWTTRHNQYLSEHDYLRKNPKRLGISNFDNSDASLIVGTKKSDTEQFLRYKKELGEENFNLSQEEFVNTKYLDSTKYDGIKRDYRDMKELKKYESVLGSHRVPSSLEEFRIIKYNGYKAYDVLQREYKVISEINGKDWNESFREKARECYYIFRQHGYEINTHGIARFLDRSRKETTFSYEDIFHQMEYPVNYYQEDGRSVRYYFGRAIITESETNEIVTIVWRNKPKTDWRGINGSN